MRYTGEKGICLTIPESHVRQDDSKEKNFFRSPDRVFHMNGAWYFATREGDQGPYPSEVQAQLEIKRFITEKTELAHFQQAREDERLRSSLRVEGAEDKYTIEFIPSHELPRMRPSKRPLSKRKVHI
jgi:hypothetical protein